MMSGLYALSLESSDPGHADLDIPGSHSLVLRLNVVNATT